MSTQGGCQDSTAVMTVSGGRAPIYWVNRFCGGSWPLVVCDRRRRLFARGRPTFPQVFVYCVHYMCTPFRSCLPSHFGGLGTLLAFLGTRKISVTPFHCHSCLRCQYLESRSLSKKLVCAMTFLAANLGSEDARD